MTMEKWERLNREHVKAEGIIETGLDFGLSEEELLSRLQNKLNITFETAKEYLKKFGKQTV